MSLFSPRGLVVELDEVDVLTAAVLRDLEEVDDAREAGFARERGRDVIEFDPAHLVHHHVPGAERVATADLHVRALPDAHAAGDLAARDRLAETFRKLHEMPALSGAA